MQDEIAVLGEQSKAKKGSELGVKQVDSQADATEDSPIGEELLQRQGQRRVLSHLQHRTPSVVQGHGGVAAVGHVQGELLQDVQLVCREAAQAPGHKHNVSSNSNNDEAVLVTVCELRGFSKELH